MTLLDEGLCEHVPKRRLHPVPQYSFERPQYPYWLQQSPYVEPRQVTPLPHWPFLEMLSAGGWGTGWEEVQEPNLA